MATRSQSLYGLMAEFDDPNALVAATQQAHHEGYRRMDAYSPFPIEELHEALGGHHTRLPLIVLVGGLVGCIGGYSLEYWVSAMAYPINVGGRPLHSWPAFIPVTFECTILVAALSAVLNYADFDGRDALLAQVDSARVVGYCGCGCATVLLAVESAAPASSSGSPIPNEATIIGADGDPLGGLLVFLEDGYLATLEVYSYDDPISPFPPMERLKLLHKSP